VSFVLDSSVTLAFVLPDEGGSAINALFERLVSEGAVAPMLWKLEVANTLLMAERRGRIDAAFRRAAIADLEMFPITLDPNTAAQAWRTTLDLAAQHRLTVYDAVYLELAIRAAVPLATLDGELIRAAGAAGVQLIGVAGSNITGRA